MWKHDIPLFNSPGNLLHDSHKNFENWFRNSWDNWGKSWHPSFRNWHFTITIRQGYYVANFQGCWNKVRSSSVCALEPEKMTKTKWEQYCGTPGRYASQTKSDYLCISADIYLQQISILIVCWICKWFEKCTSSIAGFGGVVRLRGCGGRYNILSKHGGYSLE